MENTMERGHWCNTCSKLVNPIIGDGNKCPLCGTEFVEAISSSSTRDQNDGIDLRSAFVFSVYAPIFLGLMTAFGPSIASQEYSSSSSSRGNNPSGGEEEVEQELQLVLRRRRNALTSMIRFFRSLQVRQVSEYENPERESNRNIIVIDPFNEEAMILRGPSVLTQTRSSLGDFLVGPGLDLLLHHFAQNDSSANVNPPAQKAAIEAMPSVAIEEHLQCTVCLEDLEIGNQVKEMPCKHKFHGDCIVSWLKLHNSCPVCRFRMPSDDSVIETRNEGNRYSHQARAREERVSHARRNWLPLLSPFDNFPPSP